MIVVWEIVVPNIMFQPKWYNSDKDLQVGDLVYFQKKEGKENEPWTIWRVEQIIRSDRDNLIRRAVIKYQNHGEVPPLLTDRHVKKVVQLFNIDEYQVRDDLEEIQNKIDWLGGRADEDDVDHLEEAHTSEDCQEEVHPINENQEDLQIEDAVEQSGGEWSATSKKDLMISQPESQEGRGWSGFPSGRGAIAAVDLTAGWVVSAPL